MGDCDMTNVLLACLFFLTLVWFGVLSDKFWWRYGHRNAFPWLSRVQAGKRLRKCYFAAACVLSVCVPLITWRKADFCLSIAVLCVAVIGGRKLENIGNRWLAFGAFGGFVVSVVATSLLSKAIN